MVPESSAHARALISGQAKISRYAVGLVPRDLVTASQLGRVVGRVGPQVTMVIGSTLFSIAVFLLLTTGSTTNLWTILPTMVLMGIGNPLMFATLNILNAHGVADEEQGMAAGILNASLQIGGAVFLAIVTAGVNSNGGDSAASGEMLSGYHLGIIVTGGIAAAGLVLALIGARADRKASHA